MPGEPPEGDGDAEATKPESSDPPPKADRVDKVGRRGKGEDPPKLKEWMSDRNPPPDESDPPEPTKWEYGEKPAEKSVIPELIGDGITDPKRAMERAAEKAAPKEEAEDEIEFSDPIGDIIEDLEEAAAQEILDEQRRLLESIEEKKRRDARPKEDPDAAYERERRNILDNAYARLALIIFAMLFGAFACMQVFSDDDDLNEVGDGDSTVVASVPGQDDAGETGTGPTDSRKGLACSAGTSGPDTALTAQLAAEIRGNADERFVNAELASTPSSAAFRVGSYIFTMTVFGDGETVSTAPTTEWYNPRFIVNNDAATNTYEPGGFSVDVGWWGDAKQLDAGVFDENFARVPAAEASVDVEWLDSSTLQVIATVEGPQVEVTNMRVEMSVRLQDAEGGSTRTFNPDACWTAS